MARLPDEMVDRIKREISVERLVEASGVPLKRVGKNLVGLCPFHKENKPSLTVTPSTNKWCCFGCGRGGGTVIDWVMHTEGVSVSHALQLLRRDPGAERERRAAAENEHGSEAAGADRTNQR